MNKIIIILSLVAVFAFLITANMIIVNKTDYIKTYIQYNNANLYERPMTDNENIMLYKTCHKNVDDSVSGSKLDDIFYENNLTWEKISYNVSEDVVGEYYKISGLKDKTIENTINDKLKNSFANFVNDNKSYIISSVESTRKDHAHRFDMDWDDFYNHNSYILRQEVLSNFGGIISCVNYFTKNTFSFLNRYSVSTGESGFKDNSELNREYEFLNIDLNSGLDLKFEDIFTRDADLLLLISNAYHNNIRGEFKRWYYDDEKEEYAFSDGSQLFSYESVELEIEKILKKFQYTENISFGFTPARLFMNIDGAKAEISLKDNNDCIAIYKRFYNDNIFEKLNFKNPIRVFTDVTYDNSLLYSKVEKDGDINYEYYIYDMFSSELIKNKEIIVNYIKDEIERKIKEDNIKNAYTFVGIQTFDYNDVVPKYKDVVKNDIILYCVPKISFLTDSQQDCEHYEGDFKYGNINFYNCEIIGMQNNEIITKKEVINLLQNTIENLKGISYNSRDERISEIRITDDENSNMSWDGELIFAKFRRSIQFFNIQEFTGVT